MVAIVTSGLTKRYGHSGPPIHPPWVHPAPEVRALEDLSIEVLEGEIFGFLGPNGAGKTTTIRIISGLSLPTTGTVRVNGIDVLNEPVRAKSVMGYVPDRPYLYEKLTGRELLHFVADLYRKNWSDCEPRAVEL
ncbi:MAG: ATP-binding cassette domain-containing protein, partial [Chloroflexota bacterium]